MSIFPRTAIFTDWESTITANEIIPDIAKKLDDNLYSRLLEEQRKREHGENNWLESYLTTVETLARYGITKEKLHELSRETIKLRNGVVELLEYLKRRNLHKVMITGAFEDFVLPPFSTEYDRIIANKPVFDNKGYLSSVEVYVNGNKKEHVVRTCQEYRIPIQNTIAIGDGSGDLGMIEAAGFGIAVKDAKPVLIKAVRRKGTKGYVMQTNDMRELIGVIEMWLKKID